MWRPRYRLLARYSSDRCCTRNSQEQATDRYPMCVSIVLDRVQRHMFPYTLAYRVKLVPAGAISASIALKTLVLILKSTEKARDLPARMGDQRSEETSIALSREIFRRLNRILLRGLRHLLLPN